MAQNLKEKTIEAETGIIYEGHINKSKQLAGSGILHIQDKTHLNYRGVSNWNEKTGCTLTGVSGKIGKWFVEGDMTIRHSVNKGFAYAKDVIVEISGASFVYEDGTKFFINDNALKVTFENGDITFKKDQYAHTDLSNASSLVFLKTFRDVGILPSEPLQLWGIMKPNSIEYKSIKSQSGNTYYLDNDAARIASANLNGHRIVFAFDDKGSINIDSENYILRSIDDFVGLDPNYSNSYYFLSSLPKLNGCGLFKTRETKNVHEAYILMKKGKVVKLPVTKDCINPDNTMKKILFYITQDFDAYSKGLYNQSVSGEDKGRTRLLKIQFQGKDYSDRLPK